MSATESHRTMRAIGLTAPGGPESLRLVDVPRPTPGLGDILVRVHAASINPTDWKTRTHGGWEHRLPAGADLAILGYDVSGVVEEVGPGVMLFAPGDEVFGMPMFPRFPGAYAEYVAAPARHFAKKPAGLDHVQAAALPLAALTAYQALVDITDVQAGQRVLIHAAAGGVGHLAVQIAKARGAYVIGTASAGKHEFLRGLGVDELIDYTTTDFAEAVRDVDVVIDTIAGEYGSRSLKTLRRGGTLISLNGPLAADVLAEAAALGVTADFMLVEPDHAGMLAIAELVERGKLRPEIAADVPLADAAKAHELGETGRTAGKIVLSVV
jgi:NADPH:quinone reductase-like Zn-dependent oxidoreductase